MAKQAPIPMEHCEECREIRPRIGFVNLGSLENGCRQLCPRCYNRFAAQRMGVCEPETVYFEPMTRCDAVGREHTFHFTVHLTSGLGMKAFEWVDGGPGGYRFAVMEHPETPVQEVHEALVGKIERGLAQRYLAPSDFPDPRQNRLYITGNALNGTIQENSDGPCVVIDGRQYTWKQLGEFLSPFTGFTFRLQCFDPYDDPPIEAEPERPDILWWLNHGEDEDGGAADDGADGRSH
jgi:hypothetical protein